MLRLSSWTLAAALLASTLLGAVLLPSRAEAGPGRERVLHYRISGSPQADGCGQRVVLAARNLTFLDDNRLHADVVDRVYSIERRDGRIIASGRFDSTYACDGTQISESWDLTPQPEGSLVGVLSSTWRLEPGCEPCTIVFRIRAVPVR